MENQLSSDLPTEMPFSRAEWEMVARLPRRVLVAAISAEPDRALHTVAEGHAGIESIAAGRTSDSPLIRLVALTNFEEREAAVDDPTTALEFVDRSAGIAVVLAECHRVAEILADRVSPDEAREYAIWLLGLANSVCAAARTDGELGLGGVHVSSAEREFLDALWRGFTHHVNARHVG